ncbi:MAG: hypothetical protein HC911_16900 [Chloroflexaceae bacterium]|nr:hypothetical protein [Chloroflexaceae bacterium]
MSTPSSAPTRRATAYTPEEQAAFLWLQGRMVELLLRHDLPRFGHIFGERQSAMATDERLRHYRELAVLMYLRDELFASILPRIKRRLSVAAPREMQTEHLPPRGRIDWARTSADGLRERPGEPPLTVTTRQRRRHFTTPENLLTVVTLLEYRTAVQRLLENELLLNRIQALRHPLHEIVTGCTRELAFPAFAGLVQASTAIISGHGPQTVAELVAAVAANLLPGRTSAYDELLAWRRKFTELQLLDRTRSAELPMLGSDPARDNYLYQLWLFYELADLLQQANRVQEWSVRTMQITFTWGSGNDQRTYQLQHDQGIAHHWNNAPGVRPDLYIVRADRQEVRAGSTLIWREPGYVLDAKYYRPHASSAAPGNPVKRVIADLHLTGERHGALLFAFQGQPEAPAAGAAAQADTTAPDVDAIQQVAAPLYEVTPNAIGQQTTTPDVRIGIWRVQPAITDGGQQTAQTLQALLDHIHAALKERVELRCRGVFLDRLSATAHGRLIDPADTQRRDGTQPLALDDLLLCPKPHVSAGRVDLVSLQHDCCTNAHVCHIVGQAGVQKPRRLTTIIDVIEATHAAQPEADADARIAVATQQVQIVVQRYADLVQPDIARYREWIRNKLDINVLFDTTPLLSDAQRDTLALARFLWEQIEHIKATNFAAPTLLFTGVLEEVSCNTLYKHCRPLCHAVTRQPLGKTLGTLGHSKGHGGANWKILEEDIVARGYWNEQVAPSQTLSLSVWVDMVKEMSDTRNKAAHKADVHPEQFQRLIHLYFGSTGSGFGVMNGLLLAWGK